MKINHEFSLLSGAVIFISPCPEKLNFLVFSDCNQRNSTNDVYEIDYSDYDDQETESSGNVEKLNKSSASVSIDSEQQQQQQKKMMEPSNEMVNNMNGKQYIKEHYMSNSDNELDEIDYRYHSKDENNKSTKINQIIEDYKIEVGSINHHRHHAINTNQQQLNNSKEKHTVSSKLNQSTNPVIKNYLKAKEQDVSRLNDAENYNNNRISITTSNKKLNDLSKKSKNFKDLTKPKLSNSIGYSSMKTPSSKAMHHQPPPHSTIDKTKKPKSPSASYARQDSNLDEFQIEKVVSWMSVNEENFSEFEFSMAGHVNDNKTVNDKRKTNEHDSTYQEIADIIKEIEHDRNDCEDFKSLKTDVEFKLNTILNSMESPVDSPTDECNGGEMGSNNKLK